MLAPTASRDPGRGAVPAKLHCSFNALSKACSTVSFRGCPRPCQNPGQLLWAARETPWESARVIEPQPATFLISLQRTGVGCLRGHHPRSSPRPSAFNLDAPTPADPTASGWPHAVADRMRSGPDFTGRRWVLPHHGLHNGHAARWPRKPALAPRQASPEAPGHALGFRRPDLHPLLALQPRQFHGTRLSRIIDPPVREHTA